MYAFAIFDGRSENGPGDVWLARDPVGVKPLYVGMSHGMWWFASELAAARACGLDDIVETCAMDGENLELPDASFDAVISRVGLIYFPDRRRALHEVGFQRKAG